jgi:hypothetical protein
MTALSGVRISWEIRARSPGRLAKQSFARADPEVRTGVVDDLRHDRYDAAREAIELDRGSCATTLFPAYDQAASGRAEEHGAVAAGKDMMDIPAGEVCGQHDGLPVPPVVHGRAVLRSGPQPAVGAERHRRHGGRRESAGEAEDAKRRPSRVDALRASAMCGHGHDERDCPEQSLHVTERLISANREDPFGSVAWRRNRPTCTEGWQSGHTGGTQRGDGEPEE